MKNVLSFLLKFFLSTFGISLLIVLLLFTLINLPTCQNYLVDRSTDLLRKHTSLDVTIGHITIDYLTKVHLKDILIKDYNKDTLIYVEDFRDDYFIHFVDNFRIAENDVKIKGAKLIFANTREDSTINLTKTFSKKSSTSQTKKSDTAKKKEGALDFLTFNNVTLENTEFQFLDRYNYKKIHIKVENLCIDARKLNLTNPIWKLNSLEILKPVVSIVDEVKPITPKDLDPDYLSLPFQIDMERFLLQDGKLLIQDEAAEKNHIRSHLSFSDLEARDINISAKEVELRKHSIKGTVNHFSVKEKSGLIIEELRADFFMNSYRTEGKKLYFKTEHSLLSGYLRFDYHHMREYLQFAKRVRVTSTLKNSVIDVRDLAFFSESLRKFDHLRVAFNTIAQGTMNNLKITNLHAGLNNNRIQVRSDMLVKDLFNSGKLNISAQFQSLEFDKKDIDFLFKKMLPAEVSTIGKMRYQGKFDGTPLKFTLTGDLNSNEGGLALKNTSFDLTNMEESKYDGTIQLRDIHISRIFPAMDVINNVSGEFEVHGAGFDFDKLNSSINGTIRCITLKGADYQSIDIDGNVKNKVFNGEIRSRDPSLDIIAKGAISMIDQESPDIDLSLNLKDIDLKKLNLSNHEYFFNANIEAIGKGKSIDDIIGSCLIKKMYVVDKSAEVTRTLLFSDLSVEKDVVEGNQILEIHSDEVKADLVGRYKIQEIPKLLQEYLINYLTIDKKETSNNYTNTYFILNSELKNIQNYSKLLYEDLKNIDSGKITMRFDGTKSLLKLRGNLSNTKWNQFRIPSITLQNESSLQGISVGLDFDSVYFQNNLAITPLKARLNDAESGIKLSVELLNRTDTKFVDFNSIIKKSGDLYAFNVLPFTSYFGRKVWTLDPDNLVEINFKSKTLQVSNLNLRKDRQDIRIGTKSNSDLIGVKFGDVKLEELISGFLPILKTFKGTLNGEMDIATLLTKPTPIANLSIKNIEYDELDIGDLNLKSTFIQNILNSELTLLGDKFDLDAHGVFNANRGVDSLNVATNIRKFNIEFLNKYLKSLVYDMHGNLHANLNFYGKLPELQASGTVTIDTLSTFINNIHTSYTTSNQTIPIEPGMVIMDGFKFYDSYRNPITTSGHISHNHFQDFNLNINASAPKIYCLNTNVTHNQNFYGSVFAEAEIQFSGIIGERILLKAQGRNLPNSHITLAFGTSQRIDKYGFYEFIDKGIKIDSSSRTRKTKRAGVDLDFDFDISNQGKLTIIMDPTVDDRIECTGEGRIAFKLNPQNDMDIKGSYTINSGYYKFTYQNLVQRTFYLNKGGTMTFVGNPRASNIDASATFNARANAQDLITAYYGNSNPSVQAAAKTPIKVNITLYLKDKITQPTISYEIIAEQNNPDIKTAFETISTVTKNNPSELNRQVIGILLLQRFLPPNFTGFENAGVVENNFSNDAMNAAMDVVSSHLSGYLSDFLQNTIQGMSVNLGLRNYNQLEVSNKTSNVRRNLNLALSQKLFNDRIVFNVGGNYDFGRDINSNNTAYFGGDLDIEYLLSPLGNIRLKAYSTLNNDPLNAKYINKTGGGILYQKEFESFHKLFHPNQKK